MTQPGLTQAVFGVKAQVAAAGSYLHQQMAAATVWQVAHNLGFYPGGIVVQDSAGATVLADIAQIDVNNLTITFSHATGGRAFLS